MAINKDTIEKLLNSIKTAVTAVNRVEDFSLLIKGSEDVINTEIEPELLNLQLEVKDAIVNKVNSLLTTTTDPEEIGYLAKTLNKYLVKTVIGTNYLTDALNIQTIGYPGTVGFGVGAVKNYPAHLTPMSGYEDIASPNYGNLVTANGAVFVCIPKFYYKWDNNDLYISPFQKDGYALPRAFIDGGLEKSAFYRSKYMLSNEAGVATSKPLTNPMSSHSSHNPFSGLTAVDVNNYAAAYDVCKTLGTEFFASTLFQEYAIFLISYAAGKARTNCAFADIAPYFPRGNNNNALGDVNDPSVKFISDGYSACAKTGSASNFAKSTHNGQACGIADVNGNMWRITSGLTRAGLTDIDSSQDTNGVDYFFVLKESFKASELTSGWTADDTLTKSAFGSLAYLEGVNSPYEKVTINEFNANPATTYLGNGTNQVFGFSTSRITSEYKISNLGIAKATGRSSVGTKEFGNDRFHSMHRSNLSPIVGGAWDNVGDAGLDVNLSDYRLGSNSSVGVCASTY